MRRKFARQYGFVVPEIRLSDDLKAPPKTYQIKIHGAAVTTQELRVKDCLVIIGDGPRPNLPGDEVREPAFGMRAIAIPEAFVKDAKRQGFKPIDPVVVRAKVSVFVDLFKKTEAVRRQAALERRLQSENLRVRSGSALDPARRHAGLPGTS